MNDPNEEKRELTRLRIRSLIADKELNVAEANRELAIGGWLSDHYAHNTAINQEIDRLFQALEQESR